MTFFKNENKTNKELFFCIFLYALTFLIFKSLYKILPSWIYTLLVVYCWSFRFILDVIENKIENSSLFKYIPTILIIFLDIILIIVFYKYI